MYIERSSKVLFTCLMKIYRGFTRENRMSNICFCTKDKISSRDLDRKDCKKYNVWKGKTNHMGKRRFDLDFEEKYREDLRRIRGFRLLDDDFMSKVFEDKACVELLLKIVLQRDNLIVKNVRVQYEIKNLQGRSVRLDVLAVDEDGKIMNVEIQRSDKGGDARRARYNSSLLDANITDPGDDYNELGETYVIFITERDVRKGGLPIYHIERTVQELDHAPFGDGAHIIYVNAEIKNETALGKLMHDFSCTEADDMKYKVLADRVRYFKEDRKGAESMSKVLEDMRDEAERKGMQKTLKALKLIKAGYSDEKVMESAELSEEELQTIKEMAFVMA